MGSAEGLRLAEQAIAEAARAGKMVLLKNTHLVSGWLSSSLEKRIQTLRPHPRFRLFLTMETSNKVGTADGPASPNAICTDASNFHPADPDIHLAFVASDYE